MAITFRQVSIRNIRSVDTLDVQFHPDGVTAIIGPTGAGKSTIMAVIAWVLYGESRTSGLVQSEARRDFDVAPTDPCEGVVYFTVDDTAYTARRSLSRNKKGQEVASAQLWAGHDTSRPDLPNITATTLTAKIRELTGLTGRAFAGAFYMPQNQLEALATGTPTEIQDLFEEQTGLTGLTRKVDAAGLAARDAAKTAELLPGSHQAAADADADASEAEQETRQLTADTDTADKQAASMHHQTRHAQAKVDTLVAAGASARAAQDEVTAAAALHDQALADTAIAAAAQQITAGQGFPDLAAAETADQAAQDRLADISRHGVQLRAAQDQVRVAQSEVDDTAAADMAAAQTAATQAERAAGQAAAAVEPRQATVVRIQAELTRLDKALTALGAAVGHAECPTCRQSLTDPAGLLAEMRADRVQLSSDITAAQEQVRAAQHTAQQRRTAADTARQAFHIAERATQRRSDAQQRLGRAETQLRDLLPGEDTTPDQVAAALRADHEKTTELGKAARSAAEVHRAATRAAQRAATAGQRLADAQHQAKATRAADPQQITQARQVLADSTQVYEHARDTAAQARQLAQASRTGAAVLRQVADQRQTEWDRKAAALTAAETATQIHAVLRAYREELLAEYTATVSDAATSILAQMGGDHVGFDVSPDFQPQVILTDGGTRPTRVLSGGEKTRAGLCFRLGIAEQITAGLQPGMLLTDEPTAAHDKDTRQAIMATLRSLGKPIVLISHAEEAADIADKVIRLDKVDRVTTVVTRPTLR